MLEILETNKRDMRERDMTRNKRGRDMMERHNNKLELHEALAPKNVHLFEKCK